MPTYYSAMDRPSPMLPAQFRVGTIGFSYDDWQPAFYPADTRKSDRLAAYASAFDTVELDTTFYGTPPIDRVAAWAEAVPEGFLFCPKTPRLITHDNPLAVAVPPMLAFLESLSPMHDGGKLGPILIQFPPTFSRQHNTVLSEFLGQLPATRRYAVELRHASWLHPSTVKLLSQHRCAWVGADYAANLWPLQNTADFFYLRFVGKHHRYPSYERERFDPTPQLERWLNRLRPLLPINVALNAAARPAATPTLRPNIFAFFADDYAGHAPATANRFRTLVQLPTLAPTNGRPPPAQGALF